MSINLPYVEGTSKELWHILKSRKIRSTFYTENTLRKLPCKPNDRLASEDKNISLMKMTVVTVKQSNLVNLNGL